MNNSFEEFILCVISITIQHLGSVQETVLKNGELNVKFVNGKVGILMWKVV